MVAMTSSESITISTNYWRVPTVEGAFSGILEGCPSNEQRKEIVAEAVAERAAWKPSVEAMALVQQLQSFAGCRVQVQLWDASMWFHELEGPFAFDAVCGEVDVQQVEGFQQAFLRVNEIVEIPNAIGYSPTPYIQKLEGCDHYHVSVADLYSIRKVGIEARQ